MPNELFKDVTLARLQSETPADWWQPEQPGTVPVKTPMDLAVAATVRTLGGTITEEQHWNNDSVTVQFPGCDQITLSKRALLTTLEYATKGRFNNDTKQYEPEPLSVVLSRLKADIQR